jgi:prepilin-type N-terminal cleavage/methylation domain-containing protein
MRASRNARTGLTLVEMLISLVITALLMTSVAVALKAMISAQAENSDIADVTQMSRVVLSRMMSDVRNADSISLPSSQSLSITPTTNAQGITQMTYTMSAGSLYFTQTVGGAVSAQPLIVPDANVTINSFNVSRVTFTVTGTTTATRSVTATLNLKVGSNPLNVTASACPRRNLSY